MGALAAAIRSMVRELKEKAELEKYLVDLGGAPTVAHRGSVTAGPATTQTGDLIVGAIFAGRYEILEVIGVGGMGKVYKVHDRELDDIVALKTIRKDALGSGPEVMERFKLEIKTARKVTHKNIIRTHDFGESSGVQYLSMEYVKGMTLRELLERQSELPLGIALRIARQICSGLHVAHEAGIIHRDVKSQNILIQPNGDLKIMDFGIARPLESKGLTMDGSVMGTPEIMAPEQAMGQATDSRTDIYSAGCVFFELFTGTRPFTSKSMTELLMKHVNETPPTPRSVRASVPPQVEAIILRMMQKTPAARFQTFAEVHAALAAVPESIAA